MVVTTENFDVCLFGYAYKFIQRSSIIPNGVINIIFEFQKSFWDEESSGSGLLIEAGSVLHESNAPGYICSFGMETIESGVWEWKIKIHACPSYIKIGIVDVDSVSPKLSTFGDRKYGYGYNSSGDLRNDGNWNKKRYGFPFEASTDIVICKLDMGQHTLSFEHNGKYLGVAYQVEKNKKYRFVVESYGKGDHYELLGWSTNK